MKTPITIISGYLGAGKTTLLKHILSKTDRKLAIIMNEFGEVGIDNQVVEGRNVDMTELEGGCVCCSLTGEFEEAIKEIISEVNPDGIVVETTGVAEPDAIVVDIEENLSQLRLDGIITIADADAILQFPKIGHTESMQVGMADLILLNKSDLVDGEMLKKAEKKLRGINRDSPIIHTKNCKVDLGLLFGIYSKKDVRKHNPHEVKENYFFYESGNKLDKDKFEHLVKAFPKNIYRAKGFIVTKKGSFLFNYVAGRHSLEEFKAEKNQIVFIGEKAKDKEEEVTNKIKELETK